MSSTKKLIEDMGYELDAYKKISNHYRDKDSFRHVCALISAFLVRQTAEWLNILIL